jgi:RNA polymerase sigma factor (sigma-70 family)
MSRRGVHEEMDLPPFQALLDAHGRDVHRFLVAMLGRVDADDAYQETWLAALRAYPRLRSASNLRGWILTVAHHKALDHIRARGRQAIPLPELPERPAPPPARADPELWGRVAQLPSKQRTAVALRFVSDAAYAEISAVMKTSEDAARRNVHEGLTRLRRDYHDDR